MTICRLTTCLLISMKNVYKLSKYLKPENANLIGGFKYRIQRRTVWACYLVEALFGLYVVHASRQRHAALSSVFSVKAVRWRRSLTERYFAAGGWETLFVTGGRGTSSFKGLLSVMDQFSVTEENNNFYNMPKINIWYLVMCFATHWRTSLCSRLYLPPFFKATLWTPSIALSIDCNTSSCSGA